MNTTGERNAAQRASGNTGGAVQRLTEPSRSAAAWQIGATPEPSINGAAAAHDQRGKRQLLVPAEFQDPQRNVPENQALGRQLLAKPRRSPSYIVDRHLPRTTAPHGMHGPEVVRLGDAVHFMRACLGPSRFWLLTTDPGLERSTIADIWKRITKLQALCTVPPYSVMVLEAGAGLHAHIIFPGTAAIAKRLQCSAAFGGSIQVKYVYDLDGLTRRYLVKERTPQAGFRREHLLGGRLPGSHRIEGGGDRVRLSRALERDAISRGYVKPWRHTNARRRK